MKIVPRSTLLTRIDSFSFPPFAAFSLVLFSRPTVSFLFFSFLFSSHPSIPLPAAPRALRLISLRDYAPALRVLGNASLKKATLFSERDVTRVARVCSSYSPFIQFHFLFFPSLSRLFPALSPSSLVNASPVFFFRFFFSTGTRA